MKKIYFMAALAALAGMTALSGCEDFLDTQNYTQKTTNNFPQTSADIDMMLASIYSTLNHINRQNCVNHFYVAEAASDDRFGGGGSADLAAQMADKLQKVGVDPFEPFWEESYKGIYRANMMLGMVDNITDWTDDSAKSQAVGEAKFMRALLYFQLVQIFGEVPMVLTYATGVSGDADNETNVPKSPAEKVYAQITTDLKDCIETMPDKPYDPNFSGHATKYVAEAFMARVFLFYTGYYNQDSLPLADGGNVTKNQVITWLEDCMTHGGYGLVNDFRELWPYTNPYTINDYRYTAGQTAIDGSPLEWETDVNTEVLFATKYNVYGSWTDVSLSNMFALFYGVPNTNNLFPFGQGWGYGPVAPNLYADWQAEEPNDPRIHASIIDFDNPEEGFDGEPDPSVLIEYTGLMQKKYISVTAKSNGNNVVFGNLMYGAQNDMQLGQVQDLVLMRYADVLLMHSELTGTADGMNQVRARVGLPAIAYSLDALKKERRHELAFEGLRWYDLMRWGDVVSALQKQVGTEISNLGQPTTMKEFGGGFAKRYEETGGFWPIPKAQLDLSGGVLTQNPGWDDTANDAEYRGW